MSCLFLPLSLLRSWFVWKKKYWQIVKVKLICSLHFYSYIHSVITLFLSVLNWNTIRLGQSITNVENFHTNNCCIQNTELLKNEFENLENFFSMSSSRYSSFILPSFESLAFWQPVQNERSICDICVRRFFTQKMIVVLKKRFLKEKCENSENSFFLSFIRHSSFIVPNFVCFRFWQPVQN